MVLAHFLDKKPNAVNYLKSGILSVFTMTSTVNPDVPPDTH